jgi:hypothetical protein
MEIPTAYMVEAGAYLDSTLPGRDNAAVNLKDQSAPNAHTTEASCWLTNAQGRRASRNLAAIWRDRGMDPVQYPEPRA